MEEGAGGDAEVGEGWGVEGGVEDVEDLWWGEVGVGLGEDAEGCGRAGEGLERGGVGLQGGAHGGVGGHLGDCWAIEGRVDVDDVFGRLCARLRVVRRLTPLGSLAQNSGADIGTPAPQDETFLTLQ